MGKLEITSIPLLVFPNYFSGRQSVPRCCTCPGIDGIDRLVKETDTEGNVTTSVYDMGDRRTEVNHPASGITTFTYDNLGNVLTKQTANLKKEGKTINYEYDYGRLTAINYHSKNL